MQAIDTKNISVSTKVKSDGSRDRNIKILRFNIDGKRIKKKGIVERKKNISATGSREIGSNCSALYQLHRSIIRQRLTNKYSREMQNYNKYLKELDRLNKENTVKSKFSNKWNKLKSIFKREANYV